MVPQYTVITNCRVYDEHWSSEADWSERLWEGQEAKCAELGIDTSSLANEVLCHFFDSPFSDEREEHWNVYDAIQCLAIKDGVDLVQYGNGNYGFVAYYSGTANGFEIVR